MEYQYMNINQINNMDYWSLVGMLMNQISPETRKLILEKLTEMNNQLLIGNHSKIQQDLARMGILNSRKKDVSENKHPSMDILNKGKSPIPLVMPTNYNNQFALNPYQMSGITNMTQLNPMTPMPLNNFSFPKHNSKKNKHITEIDLDDIINDIHEESDDLDEKLARIKALHTKIIADKKRRRKEREKKSGSLQN